MSKSINTTTTTATHCFASALAEPMARVGAAGANGFALAGSGVS